MTPSEFCYLWTDFNQIRYSGRVYCSNPKYEISAQNMRWFKSYGQKLKQKSVRDEKSAPEKFRPI